MIPNAMCAYCGKAAPVNECVMEDGKVFCSDKCREDSHKLNA